MFGVLKYRACSQSDEQRNQHRLHYCGTCKTIGSLYGQSSRFLLNHDTVFLSELLSAMSTAPTWARAYQSFNCMTLPAVENMPLQLRIAAHLTIVLTEFKLRDQILDSGFVGWRFAQRIFSSTFDRAFAALEELSFPLEKFHDLLVDQQHREASVEDIIKPQQLLSHEIFDYCAAPTAAITGEVFHQSVQAMGHDQDPIGSKARCVGEALGKLVYAIDAFEDFDKDLRQLQFNPLISIRKHAPDFSLEAQRRAMFPYVRAQVEEIKDALTALPISEEAAGSFCSRLISNVTERLGAGWQHVCVHSCSAKHTNHAHTKHAHTKHVHQCGKQPEAVDSRWQQAKNLVRNLQESSDKKPGLFTSLAQDLTTFAFLTEARQARDISEVGTIPFNLIAWSSLAMELRNRVRRRTPNMVLMTESTDDPTQPEPTKPRRFGKRFNENPNDEPLPEIIEKPNEETDQPGSEPNQSPRDPGPGQDPRQPGRKPEDPNRSDRDRSSNNRDRPGNNRYTPPTYPANPYRPYNTGSNCCLCWGDMCANCGCNCCINSLCDIDCCCRGVECCGGGGGTDCCACSSADCCGDWASCCGGNCCGSCGTDWCGSCGGADCCGGCGGADCCGGCGGADCCSGCSCGT